MHTIRVWHAEKRAEDLAKGLRANSAKDTPSRTELQRACEASGDAGARVAPQSGGL